jgi:hypothetical protein
MDRIYQMQQLLLKDLEDNPSKDAPYHNNYHMVLMSRIAVVILNDITTIPDIVIDHEWATLVVMTAGMLHDYAHTAGKSKDSTNILRAYIHAESFIDNCPIPFPDRMKELVLDAIRCTEYPFVIEPKNYIERVIRDADILYAAVSGSSETIMEHLRSEIEVSHGNAITYREILDNQKLFLESATLFTRAGKLMWDTHAPQYFKDMERYLELHTVSTDPVVDTCDLGHKFAKLPDHPYKDGIARCPHCMAIGLDSART